MGEPSYWQHPCIHTISQIFHFVNRPAFRQGFFIAQETPAARSRRTAGVKFHFPGCLLLRCGDVVVPIAEDMSADLSPDVAVGGLRGEIHHFLRQDIGAVDRSFNGLVLRLEGFRLVQTGHGTELSLPVDHVMEVIRETVGGDPVQRHLRDGLLAFGAFALSFYPDDLRQELDIVLTQRNIGVPGSPRSGSSS